MPPIGRKREKTVLRCGKFRKNAGLARLRELKPARFRGLIDAIAAGWPIAGENHARQ
ncbi:hypothetical protein [Paracoccus cavernae]|uniref:hypothetical protein n=1 Tax=Paracoccus cavernae TaxID=1571207 RepID=UPI00363FAAD3